MDSLEWNKIFGALLGTLLFTMGIGIVSDIAFSRHKAEKAGYELVARHWDNRFFRRVG